MSRTISRVLIGYCAALTLLNVAWVVKKGGPRYVLEQLGLIRHKHINVGFQEEGIERLRKIPDTNDEIIFAGDSITYALSLLESFTDVRNHGIGGDSSQGMLDRLPMIAATRPKQFFLNIGTNDLSTEVSAGEVAENIREIVDRMAAESPGTELFVTSVLPTNLELSGGLREERKLVAVGRLNAMIAEAAQVGKFTYLDFSPHFRDDKGQLRRNLTPDGVHLNDDGIRLYCKLLEPHVKSKELLARRAEGARPTRP